MLFWTHKKTGLKSLHSFNNELNKNAKHCLRCSIFYLTNMKFIEFVIDHFFLFLDLFLRVKIILPLFEAADWNQVDRLLSLCKHRNSNKNKTNIRNKPIGAITHTRYKIVKWSIDRTFKKVFGNSDIPLFLTKTAHLKLTQVS